LSVLTD